MLGRRHDATAAYKGQQNLESGRTDSYRVRESAHTGQENRKQIDAEPTCICALKPKIRQNVGSIRGSLHLLCRLDVGKHRRGRRHDKTPQRVLLSLEKVFLLRDLFELLLRLLVFPLCFLHLVWAAF